MRTHWAARPPPRNDSGVSACVNQSNHPNICPTSNHQYLTNACNILWYLVESALLEASSEFSAEIKASDKSCHLMMGTTGEKGSPTVVSPATNGLRNAKEMVFFVDKTETVNLWLESSIFCIWNSQYKEDGPSLGSLEFWLLMDLWSPGSLPYSDQLHP